MTDNFARLLAFKAKQAAAGAVTEEVLREALETKVDKVNGKGLSTNDFTNAYKDKLDSITNPIILKGRVDTVSQLPNNAEVGWFYFVGLTTDNELSEYVYTDSNKWEYVGSSNIQVDSQLSDVSENPVQNKVIKDALDELDGKIVPIFEGTQAEYEAALARGEIEPGTVVIITDDNVAYLPLAGGTMTGNINLDDNKIVFHNGIEAYYDSTNSRLTIVDSKQVATRNYTTRITADSTNGVDILASDAGTGSGGSFARSESMITANGITATATTGAANGNDTTTIEQVGTGVNISSSSTESHTTTNSSVKVSKQGVDITGTLKPVNITSNMNTVNVKALGSGSVVIESQNAGTSLKGSMAATVEATDSQGTVTLKHTNRADPIKVQRLNSAGELTTYDNIDSGNYKSELDKHFIELTQAEYDALDNSKYTDDKNYYITDAEPNILPIVYGFHVNSDESDPADAVTYLEDAVGMTPAAMGSTAFNYGSWANAFFMPKPCMLKFDGTVDYYLDPNDYSKKLDGTPSDYNNLAYAGNAMMEWSLIWYKFEAGVAEGEGYFYVSNKKIDDSYQCWCNYDSQNHIIDHFYTAIYNGCTYDGKMRSISGLQLTPWSTTAYSTSATYAVGAKVNYQGKMYRCTTAVETAEAFDSEKWEQFAFNGNTAGQEEIAQAMAINTTSDTEWYIDLWADRTLITGLLYLMGKSLDLQSTFGRGLDSGSQTAKEAYVTGTLDDKGLFWGVTANGNSGVKVFGMENFWGCAWHRTAGLFGISTGYAYKLTHGTVDGSTATAFGTTSAGYNTVAITKPASEYVTKMLFGKNGMLPIATGGSASTYECDYYYTGSGFALVGGGSNVGLGCGFYVGLHDAVGHRGWSVAAAPSCKPLAQKG